MSPVAGGLNSQLGVAEEATVGTAVTPARFYEFGNESLNLSIERIEYMGLRPTRRVLGTSNWVEGRRGVEGDVEVPVMNKGMALLFKHALGAVTTTTPVGGTTARDHKCTVGALDGKGLTVQVGRTDMTGTTRAFTYAGCKVTEWELAGSTDSQLMLKLSLDGMSETTATALAAASYPTGLAPFSYLTGALTVGGSAFDVTEFSLTGNNSLATDRYMIRATTPGSKKEQLEGAGVREYGGSLSAEFSDLTAYNRFVNGTVGALTITYTGAIIEAAIAYKVAVNLPAVRFDGETPSVSGPELLAQPLPFKVLDDNSVDGPVVVTITNTDTAA